MQRRLNVGADTIAMAADGVDEFGRGVGALEQFDALYAMLFRPLLEVNVMQQPRHVPKVAFRLESLFLGEPAHDGLDGQRVLEVEGFVVIRLKCFQRLLAGQSGFHSFSFFHQ